MATRNIAYVTSADLTVTLASLATSSTLVAGRESTVIDNSTNLYLDALLSGFITTGTSPTGGVIEVWVYAQINSGPAYPDVMDGTDSAETVTSAPIKRASMALAARMPVDTTSDRGYYFQPISVASLFGGVLPERWGVFVTHSTGVSLNATAGNHKISYQGIEETIA
jgi:hypothetical protein